MKLLFMNRQRGKTTRLMKWLFQAERREAFPYWNRIVLVHSVSERDRIIREFGRGNEVLTKVLKEQVHVWSDWQKKSHGATKVQIAIDNLDLILAQMFRSDIGMIALTKTPDDEMETTLT